jgi:hypothetical protein
MKNTDGDKLRRILDACDGIKVVQDDVLYFRSLLMCAREPSEEIRRLVSEDAVGDVLDMACEYFGVTKEDMISKKVGARKRGLVIPRHSYMSACCRFTSSSLDVIGSAVCRDHASVIHARDKGLPSWEGDKNAWALICGFMDLVSASFRPSPSVSKPFSGCSPVPCGNGKKRTSPPPSSNRSKP